MGLMIYLQRALRACLVAALIAISGFASGDEGSARELFEKATAARGEKNWEECQSLAAGAYALEPRSSIAGILGDCLAELGRDLEAAPYLQQFLDEPPQSITPEGAARAREQLAAIKQKVAVVTVHPSVEGAQIAVDYEAITTDAHTPLYLEPGKHTFSASHDGYETTNVEVALTAGAERRIDLTLKRKPIEGGGGGPVPTDEGVPLWAPIVMGVVGLAGIGVGIAGEVLRSDQRARFDDVDARLSATTDACEAPGPSLQADCAALADEGGAHNDLLSMEIAGFVVGGAALAASAVMFVFVENGDETVGSTSVAVTPQIAPGWYGVGVRGDF